MNRILSFLRDRHADIYKIIITLIAVVGIVLVYPKEGKFKYEYQKGKPWLHEDLIAPFDFPIHKSAEELKAEKAQIIRNNLAYFRMDSAIYPAKKESFARDFYKAFPGLTPEKLSPSRKKIYQKGHQILDSVYRRGIIQVNELIENKPPDYSFLLVRGNVAIETTLGDVYTVKSADDYILHSIKDLPPLDRKIIQELLENNITHNIFYDRISSANALRERLSNVSPYRNMRQKGERIISRGDVIDQERFQVLISLEEEYLKQLGGSGNYYVIFAGQFLLVGISILILTVFLMMFRYDTITDNRKYTFILLMIFIFELTTSIILKYALSSVYAIPFCLLPVIIRAFFDIRTAIFTHLVAILIAGIIVPNPYVFVFVELVAGIFALFSIVNTRRRSQLFGSVAIIFIIYLASYTGMSIIQEGRFQNFMWMNMGWFATSATLTLFAYPLIYIFEKIFGFISDVSLMELADINSPLLREFSVKAPGTFQHSLQVANLAEEAIFKVGGNSLLVRAGALYHDIGKMDMPMYFIENQVTGVNPHDELSFEESAAIITSHVIKGIEIARKNNLPDQVIDFIRTHHGTTKAQYFYQSFLKNFPNEKVDEAVFQYPGPIPFSKETAVLMMADSVEAASKSLKAISAESIDKLVDQVIDDQVKQDQFINADITFKNVTQIKKIFKRKLMTVYHLRIEYPR